jgi:uncharacterized membrane protein
MARRAVLRILGEGGLAFHATAIWPLWSELTLQRDDTYPLARNIVLIMVFISLPYGTCLLLSHGLYRHTRTQAPLISCLLSLAMFTATLVLYYGAQNNAEKGTVLIPAMAFQNLIGVVLFAALRFCHRESSTAG